MGLVGNFARNNGQAGYTIGPLGFNLGARQSPEAWTNGLIQDGRSTYRYGAALPMGALPPDTTRPPVRLGEISLTASGNGSMAADLRPTRAMSINLTGTGDLQATGALVVSMIAALTGSGNLTAQIEGRLDASVNMSGSGDLAATAQAFANMAAALSGTGNLAATIAAYGNMEIDIVVTGAGLTVANVGPAVWDAIAAQNNDPGTMGELLNSAGSAADPLLGIVEGTETMRETLRLLRAIALGDGSGLEGTTMEFRSQDGTKVRVRATYNAGTRTITLVDAS